MSGIYGMLNMNDQDVAYINTLGQRRVFEVANEYLRMVDEEVRSAAGLFIQKETTDHKEKYKLPGGGRMTKVGRYAQAPSVKPYGEWDVAYPLYEFESQISYTRKDAGKMTVQDLQRDLDTITIQYINALRWEILHRLLDNVQETFADEDFGDLLIEPLANGDAVLYPPVVGKEIEETEDHYIGTNYLATAIDDDSNPFVTAVQELEEHFGKDTGGSNIVTFINKDETNETIDLTDFGDVPDQFITMGQDADVPNRIPMTIPGRIIGRTTGQGATWVSEYDWIPDNYMLSIHMDAPSPLKMRIPRTEWGWASALQLVSENDSHPFYSAYYETNFGLGAGNRLNGVVLHVVDSAGYTVPDAYT